MYYETLDAVNLAEIAGAAFTAGTGEFAESAYGGANFDVTAAATGVTQVQNSAS